MALKPFEDESSKQRGPKPKKTAKSAEASEESEQDLEPVSSWVNKIPGEGR